MNRRRRLRRTHQASHFGQRFTDRFREARLGLEQTLVLGDGEAIGHSGNVIGNDLRLRYPCLSSTHAIAWYQFRIFHESFEQVPDDDPGAIRIHEYAFVMVQTAPQKTFQCKVMCSYFLEARPIFATGRFYLVEAGSTPK